MKTVFPPMLAPTHARADVHLNSGEGAWLIDTDGKRYLDFSSGIAVTLLGHCHPHLVDALCTAAKKPWHLSNFYRVDEQERLAQRLIDQCFADRVFFCNSGAESIEGAIKAARRTQYDEGHSERTEIITLTGAFHGRTMGALAATGNDKYLEGFGPRASGFRQVLAGDVGALRDAIGPQTAAVLMEPVQGEGGVIPLGTDYVRSARSLCDERGALLIFDEVQCGMARTGRLFAHEWLGVEPDIMTLAKGIGGGFPLGAILMRERVGKNIKPGTHGTTYGGGPLACAVGNAVLDVVLAPGFLEHVQLMADLLGRELDALVEKFPDVFGERRGKGLMAGIRCVAPAADLLGALRDIGLFATTAGDNVLRLTPPLIIEKSHISIAAQMLEQAAIEFKSKN